MRNKTQRHKRYIKAAYVKRTYEKMENSILQSGFSEKTSTLNPIEDEPG